MFAVCQTNILYLMIIKNQFYLGIPVNLFYLLALANRGKCRIEHLYRLPTY